MLPGVLWFIKHTRLSCIAVQSHKAVSTYTSQVSTYGPLALQRSIHRLSSIVTFLHHIYFEYNSWDEHFENPSEQVGPMLIQCLASVYDGGQTFDQHGSEISFNILYCFLKQDVFITHGVLVTTAIHISRWMKMRLYTQLGDRIACATIVSWLFH